MSEGDITQLLNKWLSGDDKAQDELFELAYSTLHKVAAGYMAKERRGHTFGPTALVHEAYQRVLSYQPERWNNRTHFYAIFALNMRRILVDHARARLTDMRGGKYFHLSLDDAGEVTDKDYLTLLELDSLLDGLTAHDSLQSSVFYFRHFIGMTASETAEVLGMKVTAVNAEWNKAKDWLKKALRAKHGKAKNTNV